MLVVSWNLKNRFMTMKGKKGKEKMNQPMNGEKEPHISKVKLQQISPS